MIRERKFVFRALSTAIHARSQGKEMRIKDFMPNQIDLPRMKASDIVSEHVRTQGRLFITKDTVLARTREASVSTGLQQLGFKHLHIG